MKLRKALRSDVGRHVPDVQDRDLSSLSKSPNFDVSDYVCTESRKPISFLFMSLSGRRHALSVLFEVLLNLKSEWHSASSSAVPKIAKTFPF